MRVRLRVTNHMMAIERDIERRLDGKIDHKLLSTKIFLKSSIC